MPEELTIDARFNGPPESANGGYTCGLLAQFVGEPAEVTLRAPPPLGRRLSVHEVDRVAELRAGDDVVAEARAVSLELSPPPAPSAAEAEAAVKRFPFARVHPFPSCFVCGPERPGGDGMHIYAGPLDSGEVCASPWTPAAELAGDDGVVRPEFIWAALDCPTSVPVANDADELDFKPIVLARFAVRRLADARAGESHVIVSWPIGVDGRKRHAGSALYTEAGELLAYSRALWIELRE